MTRRRFSRAAVVLGVLFNGCTATVDSGPAEPAWIAPTQFLRPVRDSTTGTWVAAWVDPANSQLAGASDSE